MDLKCFIGDKIRELRLRHGMNQEQLADKLDTTKQTISRYEKGDRQANQDILFKLSDVFNVSVDEFFPKSDKRENELERALKMTTKELNITDIEFLNQLIEKTLSMDEEEREKFLESIRFTVDYYDNINRDRD